MQLATEDREDHEGHHHADGAGGERIDLAARSLPRRRFFSDMPDRGLFAAVVVLGFPLIIGLKLYEFDARLVAAFAVALMIAYGVIAYKIPAVHVRLDRLGDNFYYIGFIFTLASMSAALLQLTRGADIEALLGSFGIALFTTIVGVAGRVLFVQLRSEIDDVEATVRRNLLAASNDLKGQLALSLREFETFHKSVLQVSSESVAQASDAAETQIERIGQLGKLVADQVQDAFKSHQNRLAKMDHAIQDIVDRVEQLGDDLDVVFKRLNAIVDGFATVQRRRRRRWYWPFGGGM
jgi:hypothetical protein